MMILFVSIIASQAMAMKNAMTMMKCAYNQARFAANPRMLNQLPKSKWGNLGRCAVEAYSTVPGGLYKTAIESGLGRALLQQLETKLPFSKSHKFMRSELRKAGETLKSYGFDLVWKEGFRPLLADIIGTVSETKLHKACEKFIDWKFMKEIGEQIFIHPWLCVGSRRAANLLDRFSVMSKIILNVFASTYSCYSDATINSRNYWKRFIKIYSHLRGKLSDKFKTSVKEDFEKKIRNSGAVEEQEGWQMSTWLTAHVRDMLDRNKLLSDRDMLEHHAPVEEATQSHTAAQEVESDEIGAFDLRLWIDIVNLEELGDLELMNAVKDSILNQPEREAIIESHPLHERGDAVIEVGGRRLLSHFSENTHMILIVVGILVLLVLCFIVNFCNKRLGAKLSEQEEYGPEQLV